MLLYVRPEHRNTPTAMRLVHEWEKLAKQFGAKQLGAGTSSGYRTDAVVRLYERLGFTKMGITLTKEI